MKKIVIFTDGAVRGNPGDGGWAARLEHHENGRVKHAREISGCVANVTNNQMEFQAIVEAMELLRQPCAVTIYTDSMVAVAWTRKKPPRENAYAHMLKRRFEHAMRFGHKLRFVRVKGHSGVTGNERVDAIAFAAARGLPLPEEGQNARAA